MISLKGGNAEFYMGVFDKEHIDEFDVNSNIAGQKHAISFAWYRYAILCNRF